MADLTQDWTSAPQVWEDFARTIPNLENMPDSAHQALREKFFQEQVHPAMRKQGAEFSPEQARRSFMEKTERTSKAMFPRAELIGKTALSAIAAPAATGLLGPHEAEGAKYWQVRAEEAAKEAEKQGISTTPYKMAGEMIGQAPYWAAGLGGAGALGKELAVSSSAQKMMNIAAGGLVQGSYDAAKAEDGHRITEGLSGAKMGAAGVAAFELGGSLLSHLKTTQGLSGEEAEAVAATVKGAPTPKQEAVAASVVSSRPEVNQSIQSWVTEQVKAANRNGIPKGKEGLIAEPGSRVKIKMTLADGKPYSVGGVTGIDVKDLPAFVKRIGMHLDKGGSIDSVSGDTPAINDLYRQFEAINRERGEYQLDIPLKGQAESVVPTQKVVSPDRSKDELARRAQRVMDVMFPPEDEGPAAAGLEASPTSIGGVGEKAAPVEPTPTPPGVEAPGAAQPSLPQLSFKAEMHVRRILPDQGEEWNNLTVKEQTEVSAYRAYHVSEAAKVATKQLGEVRGYITSEQMPYLDKLEVLANGRVRNNESGQIYKNVADALQEPPKAGSDRREFLKRFIGGAAATALPKVSIEGALKGLEAGNKNALDLINGILENAVGTNIKKLDKGFAVLENTWSGARGNAVRSFRDLANLAAGEGADTADLVDTITMYAELPLEAQKLVQAEVLSSGPDVIEQLIGVPTAALKAVDPRLPQLVEGLQGVNFYHINKPAKDLFGKSAAELNDLAKKSFNTLIETEKLRSGESVIRRLRPTGMELVRTPLPLGESGEGGVLTRYGAGEISPAKEGGWSYKETPLVSRVYGPGMELGQTARASGAPEQMTSQLEGLGPEIQGVTYPPSMSASGKPLVMLTTKDRNLLFHEMTHAHIMATGLAADIDDVITKVSPEMIHNLQGAFEPELRKSYNGWMSPEELYTYSATAVRNDDLSTIQKMADADGGHENYLDWVAQATNDIREKLAEQPDSLHRRVFERKLNEVTRRASGFLEDMQSGAFNAEGMKLTWFKGKFTAETPEGTTHTFTNHTQLAEWLDRNYEEPLTAPNLVDESSIPAGTPRYGANLAGHSNKKPPIHTDPLAPLLGEREPARGGMMLAWRYFQPFADWIDIVARKNNMPELSDLFGRRMQNAVEGMEAHVYEQQKGLKSTLGQFNQKRQADLFSYLGANPFDRAKVASELRISPKEISAMEAFEAQMAPLADMHGSSVQKFTQQISPLLKAKGYDLDALIPRGSITKEDVEFWKPLLERGQVDPNDTNLLRVADTYVRHGARKTYLGDITREAEKFLNLRNAEGDKLVGDLQTPLERHLAYIKGMPDYTTTIINSSLNHAMELINSGLERANKALPERYQIEPIEMGGQDMLSKWILFSYAGAIGLRPALVIRSALQTLITGYPILGGKYLARGIAKVFEGKASEAYKFAEESGWLLRPRDYGNLYSGEGSVQQGAMSKLAEKSLATSRWGDNSARLVVGWGHYEKFVDALKYRNDPTTFLRKSNLDWLPRFKQDAYMKEVSSRGDSISVARRAAKDLVDASQWNFRRGAGPGIYEYGLGRLFGQFGTWPLNYIEYARKLATHSNKGEQIAAITRLALAHGAILSAGNATGVDTAQWVFTQPMAYGGGPIFSAVRNIPGSLDFESQRGAEARKELIRPIWPAPLWLPGGTAVGQLIDAINEDKGDDIYKVMMGFKPMKAGEELRGEHGLLP